MELQRVSRQEMNEEPNAKQAVRIKVRLLPIWLRLLIVAVLIVIMAVFGAIVGYSIIGGGQVVDVFKPSTWTHIGDIVNKGT